MKKHLFYLTLAATALLVSGCFPTEFIWWSPDGQTAAVRASDGLRLADANGKLSAIVLPGEIQSAAWLADNSGIVVSRSLQMKDWAAIEKLLPPEEAAATKELARAMPDLLKGALTASGGSLTNLEQKFFQPLGISDTQDLEPAWHCALSLYRERIVAAIAGFKNSAELQAELLSPATNGISLYEISLLPMRNGRPAGEPRAIIRSVRQLLDPILSPHHSIVAFRTSQGALKAMTLDGKSSLLVADENVGSAAWSADGRALIYVVRQKAEIVGQIRSRTIVNGSGELQPTAAQAETLALAAFIDNAPPRLAVLPDGRILFASVPITLPARIGSIHFGAQQRSESPMFFLLDPAQGALDPVPVAVNEGSLPVDLHAFALSPDGRFVAVVEGGSDLVAVLELATGKAQIISHARWNSRMIPAWRNNRELTFAAAPSPTATRPELMLWQPDAPARILSKDWPDNVVKPWLDVPSGGNQPAK